MKKYISMTLITCSALFAFSNPISAGEYRVGDVFYCESEAGGFLSTLTNWQHKHWKPFKFKYQIKKVALKYVSKKPMIALEKV